MLGLLPTFASVFALAVAGILIGAAMLKLVRSNTALREFKFSNFPAAQELWRGS